jgi:LacI family transcriptional regulator
MTKLGKMRSRPVVALLVETSNAFSRELLSGIRDWIRFNRSWAIHLSEQGRGNQPSAWLRHWKGDGIIARIENREIEAAVSKAQVPVVNVSASGLASQYPSVISDSLGIARLAANHLIERGIKSFGYCGDARFSWSQQHGIHFENTLSEAGFSCRFYPSKLKDALDWAREQNKLALWLNSLPKPVGIMTCYDIRGQQVLDVCRAEGLHVPDEVAVIGQHNDAVLCDLCDPPLSSVIPGAREAGHEAAALLDAMMHDRPVEPRVHSIAPIGVATRQSTDIVAVDDPRLKRAARYMRDHVFEKISVEDLVKVSGMSRTLLERQFKQSFGVSPYEQILTLKLNKAERLIVETKLSLAEISDRLGFSSPEHFNATFNKRKGHPPGYLRKYYKAERSK